MIRLILIRHGVTAWNEQQKYIGSTDLNLSKKGCAQARAASDCLRNEPLTAIYSSEYKRSQQTAEIIGENHDSTIRTLSGLNEIDFGEWEGLTFEQIEKTWPNFIPRWLRPEENLPPQGELISMFKQRVKAALSKIVARNSEGMVAVIAHAGPIKLIICHFLGLDFSEMWRIQQDSCGISKIDLYDDGRNVLSALNDTCHLRNLDLPGDQI